MNKYSLVLALSVLYIGTSESISDLQLSSQLLRAIAYNNVPEMQVLLSTAKEHKMLTQRQKDAIVEAARSSVRKHKAFEQFFCGLLIDTAKVRKGLLLSALGIGGFMLGKEVATVNKLEIDSSGRLTREYKLYSWISLALKGAGIGSIGYGLWKLYEAFQLDDCANAQKIKELVENELFNREPEAAVKPEAVV
jgi:hypothetical protein